MSWKLRDYGRLLDKELIYGLDLGPTRPWYGTSNTVDLGAAKRQVR